MKTFNQELKNEIVTEIIRHRKADQIIQGTYGTGNGDEWKGCAVGCAIRSLNIKKGMNLNVSSHIVYEDQFGIPVVLARLEDRIFEGLSVENCKTWPENFMYAIPVNTDLSLVWPKFAVWLLNEVIGYAKNDDQRLAIKDVTDLYLKVISGETVSAEQWRSARRNVGNCITDAYAAHDAVTVYSAATAAAAAYYDAATATATNTAYAADAAACAADAYAYAAHDAATVYVDAAAYNAHRIIFYKKMADKLIEILGNTK